MNGKRAIAHGLLLSALLSYGSLVASATFVVTSAADPGDGVCDATCTLREAITAANAASSVDTINFGIRFPKTGEILIQPATSLPTITQPVTIDGYSQGGTSVNTLASGSDAKLRIRVHGGNVVAVSNGLAVCANGVTIRGLSITGFNRAGISYGQNVDQTNCAAVPTGGVIAGNFLGLRADGITPSGNSTGAFSRGQVVVGGNSAVDRNVISGATGAGISIAGAGAQGSSIVNNLIGTDKSGALDRGNASQGVFLSSAANSIVVGTASARNVIAYNGTGLAVGNATGNTLFANHVHDNDQLGIDVANDGVTSNDVDDSDTGSNTLQNFPVVTAASRTPTGVSANLTLDVGNAATQNYRIALYASPSCDPSGHGEGEQLLTNQLRGLNTGNESFVMAATTATPLAPGTVLTATATGPGELLL